MKVRVEFDSELVEDKALEAEGFYRILIPETTNNFAIPFGYVTLVGIDEPMKQGVYKVEFLNDMGTVVVSRTGVFGDSSPWSMFNDTNKYDWEEVCDGRVVKSIELIA